MSCPFYTSVRLLDRMRALGLSRACMNQKAKLASKAQLVDDWRAFVRLDGFGTLSQKNWGPEVH